MEYIILILIAFAVVAVIVSKLTKGGGGVTGKNAPEQRYFYSRKDSLMTDAEARFFHRLQKIVESRYYVFPQIHLSALLKNETKGTYWKAAFQRINRTSVDYVLADRETLKPVYAVELDDWSHDNAKRQKRDNGVEEMLKSADIALVRFRDTANLSDEDIINSFRNANHDPQQR